MKAKIRWLKTDMGYTLLGFTDVLQRGGLPTEYVNGRGPKYWYVPPMPVDLQSDSDYIAYYADFHEHQLRGGMVLSPDEWTHVMQVLVDAGDRLAEVRKMIEAGEEITMQV